MGSQTIKQIIIIKYYNRTIDLDLEKIIVELWNIYRKEKNNNQAINKEENSFRMKFEIVLN